MSSDNYNMIIQLDNGTWVMSPNHSMSELMSEEERRAYEFAMKKIKVGDPIFATQEEAYAAADREDSEYGTFSHEWRDWFNNE